MEWMRLTVQTGIVIGLVFTLLAVLFILDRRRRSIERKGFMPMPTSRGDRCFLSLIITVIIGLMWLAWVERYLPIEWSLVLVVAVWIIMLKKG